MGKNVKFPIGQQVTKNTYIKHLLVSVKIYIYIYNNICYHLESESCSIMSDSLQTHGLYSPWNSPGQNTGMGSLSLLQGIFPTQGSNLGLPH